MEAEKERQDHNLQHEIGLGITLVRALLLVALGLSLFLIPEKTHKMLFNAMGLFWLTTGIVLVRREAHTRGNRLLLVAAILGVVAGVLVLTRDLSRQWLAEVWVRDLLGAVILLTGVLHATSQLRLGRQIFRSRPLVNVLLGAAEIFLGALLILAPADQGPQPILYYVATAWALITGGFLLVTTGLEWLKERRAGKAEEPA